MAAEPARALDEFIAEAESRVALHLPPGSRPQFLGVEKYTIEDAVFVCGRVRLATSETAGLEHLLASTRATDR